MHTHTHTHTQKHMHPPSPFPLLFYLAKTFPAACGFFEFDVAKIQDSWNDLIQRLYDGGSKGDIGTISRERAYCMLFAYVSLSVYCVSVRACICTRTVISPKYIMWTTLQIFYNNSNVYASHKHDNNEPIFDPCGIATLWKTPSALQMLPTLVWWLVSVLVSVLVLVLMLVLMWMFVFVLGVSNVYAST